MAYAIPDDYGMIVVTVTNAAGGLSAESSIRFGFSTGGTFTQSDADALATVCRGDLKTIWDNQWSVGPCTTYFRNGSTLQVFETTATSAGTASAADYASPAVALVVTKRTGIAGKGQRGRVYLPGVPETLISEAGIIDSTYLASVQTALNTFRTNFTGVTAVAEMELLHDESSPLAASPTIVTSLLARNVVATMRPRQRR